MMLTELQELRQLTEDLIDAEIKLNTQTKQWEYAFDAMPQLVFVVDLNHKITFINKSMSEKIDKSKNDVLGKSCHEAIHCVVDGSTCFCNLENGHRVEIGEFQIPNLGGWFEFTRSSIKDDGGNTLGFICVLSDITDKKQIEAVLEEVLKNKR